MQFSLPTLLQNVLIRYNYKRNFKTTWETSYSLVSDTNILKMKCHCGIL
jgi:hypothetical protein